MTPPIEWNLGMTVTEAAAPPEAVGRSRAQVRLLVVDRRRGVVRCEEFTGFPSWLGPGDVLVYNDSRTIPAALPALWDGVPARVHLAVRLSSRRAIVEKRRADGGPDPALSDRNASVAILSRLGDLMALGRVVRRFHPESRLWVIDTDRDLYELAPLVGDPIRYGYVDRPYPLYYYQTIFGRVPGSAEMPSAGRPFTYEIVARMVERGVILCPITLHTSVSSHEVTQGLARYPVLPEYYHIPRRTVRHITEARQDGRRIIALGTTVVRGLETWAASGFGRRRGWTRYLITPNNPPLVVTNLVTGLHDNFSSHLALLYAFVDPPFLREAYRQAGLAGFRWHEFGDLSFIV